MRRLAAVLLLMSCPAFGAAPDMEVTAAWNGRYLPNAATEISVRLASAHGSEVEVSATTPAATVATRVETTAGVPLVVHLPLAAPGHGVVDVRLTSPGEQPVRSRLRLQPAERALTVLATAADLVPPDSTPARVVTNAASLPVFAQGYDIVRALAIDGATLARLSTRQIAALQERVAGCGRTALLHVPPDVKTRLRAVAGCGGRDLHVLDHPGAIADFFRTEAVVDPLPAAASLSTLLRDNDGAGAAGLLFALAGLVVLAVATLARAGVPLAGLIAAPMVGAVMVAAVASTLQPRTVDTTYADMVSGDATARFVRLVRVNGGGPGRITVSVEPGWIKPRGTGDLSIEATGTTFDDPRLEPRTAFLARSDFVMYGARPLAHPLSLTMDGVLPFVANVGATPIGDALLAWRDDEFAVPTLQPGEAWSPGAGAMYAAQGPLRHLLRARSGDRRPALLAPLERHRDGADGWVLIRAAGGVRP